MVQEIKVECGWSQEKVAAASKNPLHLDYVSLLSHVQFHKKNKFWLDFIKEKTQLLIVVV